MKRSTFRTGFGLRDSGFVSSLRRPTADGLHPNPTEGRNA